MTVYEETSPPSGQVLPLQKQLRTPVLPLQRDKGLPIWQNMCVKLQSESLYEIHRLRCNSMDCSLLLPSVKFSNTLSMSEKTAHFPISHYHYLAHFSMFTLSFPGKHSHIDDPPLVKFKLYRCPPDLSRWHVWNIYTEHSWWPWDTETKNYRKHNFLPPRRLTRHFKTPRGQHYQPCYCTSVGCELSAYDIWKGVWTKTRNFKYTKIPKVFSTSGAIVWGRKEH